MKKTIFLLFLLTACSSVNYEEHSEAGSKYVLKNGLTVLMKENPDTGMVGVDLMLKKSIASDDEKHGLSNFANRLLLAGTSKRSRDDIVKEIESVGGSIKARTYAEYSEIVVEVPSDSLSIALDVLQDVLLNPLFAPEEVERERTLILGELESKNDQPNVAAEELFMKLMYANHPYQHPIDGYADTVKAITREDIVKHYNEWYVPNNMFLSIVGNIREKPTVKVASRLFGRMKSKTLAKESVPELSSRTFASNLSQDMALESFYIQYGYQLVPASNPDFIKLRLANAVLGSGSGSRLFYELRDKRALAYSVYSIAPSTRSTGFLKVSMISRPQVLNESLAGIAEQLELLKKEKVPAEELKVVKQKLKGFFFLDHQKTLDQANYLGLYEMQGLGYKYDVEYPKMLDSVSSDDIQQVAIKYFNNPAIAIVGPFEDAIK